MKLEDQVASLELCKRLKELGVKQESYFWWAFGQKEADFFVVRYFDGDPVHFNKVCSAFTVAELGEILPMYIEQDGTPYYFHAIRENGDSWMVGYYKLFESKYYACREQHPFSEADARAKMLIYLLENKMIEGQKGGEGTR